MREDQYLKLKGLQDRLIDVFLEEGDPINWPGFGTPIKVQTKEDRGDAFWCKKSAAQTLLVAGRIGTLTAQHEGNFGPSGDPGDDQETVEANRDREVALVTREAQDLIARVRGRTKG